MHILTHTHPLLCTHFPLHTPLTSLTMLCSLPSSSHLSFLSLTALTSYFPLFLFLHSSSSSLPLPLPLPLPLLPLLQQPGVPLHTTVHLGDHPAPVIGMGNNNKPPSASTSPLTPTPLSSTPTPTPLSSTPTLSLCPSSHPISPIIYHFSPLSCQLGYGPSPMQYSMIQQQQHMGPGQMMAPGPGLAHRQGLMQGPGPGQMMATGPGPMQGPPYGMPQGQVVMGNMYMSQVPVRAGPYHQR